MESQYQNSFFEIPELGFDGRLISIARRTIKDCLTENYHCELETPIWSAMVVSMQEVAHTHNLGFRPTGVMREAYVSYLNSIYSSNAAGRSTEDVSKLKINEIANWFRVWTFMEMCGLAKGDVDHIEEINELNAFLNEENSIIPCPHCHGRGGDVDVSCPDCLGIGYDRHSDKPFSQCHTCYGDGEVALDICPRCSGTRESMG